MRWGSGQVVQVERKRGPVWYAHYREPSGRQRQKLIGPAWTGRGRPPAGYHTRRTAEDWLRDRQVEDAQRAAVAPPDARMGITFAEAAQEYLRYAEEDRGCKPSTIRGYRPSSTPICCPSSARCASRTSASGRSSSGGPGFRVAEGAAKPSRIRPRITSSCSVRRSS